MDNSYPRDNRLIRCKYDNLSSSPCLAPRCRLTLTIMKVWLLVNEKGTWAGFRPFEAGRVLSTPLSIKLKWGTLQYERTKVIIDLYVSAPQMYNKVFFCRLRSSYIPTIQGMEHSKQQGILPPPSSSSFVYFLPSCWLGKCACWHLVKGVELLSL